MGARSSPSGVRVTSFFSKGAPPRNSSAAFRHSAAPVAGNSPNSFSYTVLIICVAKGPCVVVALLDGRMRSAAEIVQNRQREPHPFRSAHVLDQHFAPVIVD